MASSMSTPVPVTSLTGDPFTQVFTWYMPDGAPFNLSIADLDSFNLYNVRTTINYGSQLGASLLLLVVLLLLTKVDKRRSSIFVLNGISLALNVIRNTLQCCYFTSRFAQVYAFFANDFSRVPRQDYATSVTADVLTSMLLICIETSLVLQTRVICTTMKTLQRRVLVISSLLVALVAIAFRLALSIENSRAILAASLFLHFEWLASATNITTTVSICYFCIIFTTKLGFALKSRRQLGLNQFGPMQIIFIMGCQTMVIPSLFAILQYVTPHTTELSTNVLTLAAILLPLSSMWASSSLVPTASASQTPNSSHHKFLGSYATTLGSYSDKSSQGPRSPLSPLSTTTRAAPASPTEEDLEAQNGVRVQQSFSVSRSGKKEAKILGL